MTKTRPRFKSDIRIKKDTPKAAAKPDAQPCAAKNCAQPGNCRVPKSRENLSDYLFLCTAHARAHNESWDFFKGMGDTDVEKFREEAMFGHRPTWPMGKRTARHRTGQGPLHIHDGHAVFEEDDQNGQPRRPERQLTRLQVMAMDTLQLAHNATLIEIKARYKELVKRFHPDANGGDRGAEERLKQVIKAYGVLRASGLI
jgi:DnaJ domain